jgi:hypothetical protein
MGVVAIVDIPPKRSHARGSAASPGAGRWWKSGQASGGRWTFRHNPAG